MSTLTNLVCHPNTMAKLESYPLHHTQKAHRYLSPELVEAFAWHRCYRDDSDSSPEDLLLIAKFFTPDSCFTWYASEFDEEALVFYGFVVGPFPEWGSFSLRDLEFAR